MDGRDTMNGRTREQVRRMRFDQLCMTARAAGVTLSELAEWALEGVDMAAYAPRVTKPTETGEPR